VRLGTHHATSSRGSTALLGGGGSRRLATRSLSNSTHLRCRFLLEALEFAALGLVLGVNFIALAVSRSTGSNGLLFLLAGLTQHGAHVLEFELEFGRAVLSEGLGDLFELLAGSAQLLAETFALTGTLVNLGLEDDDATLEFDELVGESGILLLPVEAFTLETLDCAVKVGDLGTSVDDELLSLLGSLGEEVDLTLVGVNLALSGNEFVLELITSDDDELVLLTRMLEGFDLLVSLELSAAEAVFQEG